MGGGDDEMLRGEYVEPQSFTPSTKESGWRTLPLPRRKRAGVTVLLAYETATPRSKFGHSIIFLDRQIPKEVHITMTQHPTSLDDIHDQIWRMLQEATGTRHHGFHLPTLATVSENGEPAARIVVLRGADRAGRYVTCHTDARAPKVAQVDAQSLSAWVFYDAEARVQVRALGRVAVLDPAIDAFAREAWLGTNLSSRRCYMAPSAPSLKCDAPSPNLPESVRDRLPTEEESQAGLANFRVLKATIEAMDYLHLAHDGHIRARFVYDGDGKLTSTWLEP